MLETFPGQISEAVGFADGDPVLHAAAKAMILSKLPGSAAEGISRIQLSLGKAYMEERVDEDFVKRDPYTQTHRTAFY